MHPKTEDQTFDHRPPTVTREILRGAKFGAIATVCIFFFPVLWIGFFIPEQYHEPNLSPLQYIGGILAGTALASVYGAVAGAVFFGMRAFVYRLKGLPIRQGTDNPQRRSRIRTITIALVVLAIITLLASAIQRTM